MKLYLVSSISHYLLKVMEKDNIFQFQRGNDKILISFLMIQPLFYHLTFKNIIIKVSFYLTQKQNNLNNYTGLVLLIALIFSGVICQKVT